MSQASRLRSFAITAEHVAGLMTKLARARAVTKAEAELLSQQLRSGAEVALDVAQHMERSP